MTHMPNQPPFSLASFRATGEELITLLEQETELTRKIRKTDRAALLERKQALVEAWKDGMAYLADNPATLQSLPGADKQAFRTLGERLETALHANLKSLETAHKSTGRVIGLIAEAVQKSTATSGGYTAKGTGINAYGGNTRPLSVNTDLEL